MKFGVIYPQTEIGHEPSVVRDYAVTAEGLGFSHIIAYEHVLGANPERPEGWKGPYTYQDEFIEPFVLFSFMAAVTTEIELTTGIMILPQRQTVLVAKQAACLDVLSGGRLRLGIGIGWNAVEYAALNHDFHNRGRRVEEQIDLLRQLWRHPLVEYQGKWHTIPDAGLNPLPSRKSIPIWFGGHADPVLRRAARLGDGWMPNYKSANDALISIEKLDLYLDEVGKIRGESNGTGGHLYGMEARIPFADGNPNTWLDLIRGWVDVGATHISFNTMGSGFQSAREHIEGINKFAATIKQG